MIKLQRKIEISVVVVEKGSPVAGAAIEAAHEYLDKNQGAKVEVVKIISKKMHENDSGGVNLISIGVKGGRAVRGGGGSNGGGYGHSQHGQSI